MSRQTIHFRNNVDGGPIEHCSNTAALRRRMEGEARHARQMGDLSGLSKSELKSLRRRIKEQQGDPLF